MTKALIFGVSGQDGAFLAKRLIKSGEHVYGVTRNISNYSNLKVLNIHEKVSLKECNLLSEKEVMELISWIQPNEIYFLGGQTSVGKSFLAPVETVQSNTLTTLYILEAIRRTRLNCKFYNAASSEIYGNTPVNGANETSRFHPMSPYAVSKIQALDTVRLYRETYDIYAVNGILFNHESFLRPETFVTQKIILSAALIKLGRLDVLELGNLNISRDWGWAPEYVDVMKYMLQLTDPEDFVIGTGTTTRLEDYVKLVFEYFSLNYQNYISVNDNYIRLNDITYSKSDPSKAFEKLKWRATITLEQTIEMMCDYQMEKLIISK